MFNRTLIIYRHQQAKAQHPQVAEGLKTLLEHSYRVCGLTPQTQPDPEFNTNLNLISIICARLLGTTLSGNLPLLANITTLKIWVVPNYLSYTIWRDESSFLIKLKCSSISLLGIQCRNCRLLLKDDRRLHFFNQFKSSQRGCLNADRFRLKQHMWLWLMLRNFLVGM